MAAVTFTVAFVPMLASDPLVPVVLKGHAKSVSTLAWAKDGKTLATASDDRSIRVWNTSSAEQSAAWEAIAREGYGGPVVAFTANLDVVAINYWGEITIRNMTDNKVIAKRDPILDRGKKSALRPDVYAMAFSPDGKRLATAGSVAAVGRSTEPLDSLRESCRPCLITLEADLSTDDGVQAVADKIRAISSGQPAVIDGIVHSAGSLVPLEPYDKIDANELVQHFRIHVATPLNLFQTLSQSHSIKRMLFIDSYSATAPQLGWSAYSIIKSAAQMATRCAAKELASTRIIRAYPGAVNTRIVEAVLRSQTETAATFAAMLEKGEIAEADQVAEFLVTLLVDASDKLLASQESFDFRNSTDRENVARFHGRGSDE